MTDYSKLISVIDRILTNTRFVVPNHQVARLLEYTKELERENEALKRRIEKLESYNLALANESHSKSEQIEALKAERDALMQRYGDNWYDGYIAARDDQKRLNYGCISDYSDSDILQMSEHAESEYLKKVNDSDGDKLVSKFATEQKIQALEGVIKKHSTIAGQTGASGAFKIVEVEYIKKEIDELRTNAGGK